MLFFSIFIFIYIVNYIIILLVLIIFISNNFKFFFWDAGGPTGPNWLPLAKIWREKPFGYPKNAYKSRGGGWPTCHFIFSPSQLCPEAPTIRHCRRPLSSQCYCRRRSLSCSVSSAAVTRVSTSLSLPEP